MSTNSLRRSPFVKYILSKRKLLRQVIVTKPVITSFYNNSHKTSFYIFVEPNKFQTTRFRIKFYNRLQILPLLPPTRQLKLFSSAMFFSDWRKYYFVCKHFSLFFHNISIVTLCFFWPSIPPLHPYNPLTHHSPQNSVLYLNKWDRRDFTLLHSLFLFMIVICFLALKGLLYQFETVVVYFFNSLVVAFCFLCY